jgi:hypothetical protein
MAGQTGSEAVLAAVRAKTIEQLVGQVGAAVTKEQEPDVAELHDRKGFKGCRVSASVLEPLRQSFGRGRSSHGAAGRRDSRGRASPCDRTAGLLLALNLGTR